MSFPSEFPK